MQNNRFSCDAEIWSKLKNDLPDDFGEAVQFILDAKGITQSELAMRIGVSRFALSKWWTGPKTLKHVVAICIALDIRADVGEELVRIAGLAFRNSCEHNLLHAMLFETRDLTVERANEILRQNGMEPVSRSSELADIV